MVRRECWTQLDGQCLANSGIGAIEPAEVRQWLISKPLSPFAVRSAAKFKTNCSPYFVCGLRLRSDARAWAF